MDLIHINRLRGSARLGVAAAVLLLAACVPTGGVDELQQFDVSETRSPTVAGLLANVEGSWISAGFDDRSTGSSGLITLVNGQTVLVEASTSSRLACDRVGGATPGDECFVLASVETNRPVARWVDAVPVNKIEGSSNWHHLGWVRGFTDAEHVVVNSGQEHYNVEVALDARYVGCDPYAAGVVDLADPIFLSIPALISAYVDETSTVTALFCAPS